MASFRRETTFRVFNIIFTLGGVPLYNAPKSFVYTIFVVIMLFCCCSTTLALIIKVYIHFDDLDKAVDAIITLPPVMLSLWIQINIRFRKNNLLQLLHFADCFAWEDLPPKDPVTGNTSMGVWIRRIKTTAVRVTTLGPSVYFLHCFTRIIISEERFLTLDAWYPYDWSKSPVYEITNIIQVIAALGFAAFMYTFPPFYATLVLIACSQLEKLRNTLLNIKQKCTLINDKVADETKQQFQTSEEMFSHMKKQLNKCIRLHQDIIRFTKELEDGFSTLFVGILLILMLALCFASFSAVLRWGNAVNVTQSVAAYFVFFIFVFLFCWFPSELTDQADRVRDAAWSCDWVGTPVGFQRALSILMTCANKEIIMTAGNCVPVSKETMMNMIQQSISLFMFLLQVREANENQD